MLRVASPAFIEPCLPSAADKPPPGSNWIHEIKHDGYRLMARRVTGVPEDDIALRVLEVLVQRREDRQAPLIAAHHLASIMQERTLRWFTATTTSGKRAAQSLPRRVSSRMPTVGLEGIVSKRLGSR